MYLNITTTAGCRGSCVYCPQSEYQGAMAGVRPTALTAAEFAGLMPRLSGTHFKAFSFGGFSEPFDNSEIVALFEISQAQSFVDAIWVYTTGEAVGPDMLSRLRSIRFDYVDVSCHGSGAGAHRKARPFVDEDRVMENVYHLLDHRDNIRELTISVSGPFMPEAQRAELRAACHRKGARLDVRDLHDRAGLLKIGRRKPIAPQPFRCGKHDFQKPVLLPGGDLSLCCQDFALRHILGNLHANTFEEIMEQSPLRRHVLSVASGAVSDENLACYRCIFCLPASAPA
jgi:hypothetical protein